MTLCPVCQEGELDIRHENHRYVESGLPTVTLENVEVSYCPACGERILSIPRMAELHKMLAFAVASQRQRLSPAEVKFLRKYLGWSGASFAKVMGTAPATVSRWENGKQAMGVVAEHLLRALVFRERPVEEYPSENLADLALEDGDPVRLAMRVGRDGEWHVQKAA